MRPRHTHDEDPFVPVEEVMTVNVMQAVNCLSQPALYADKQLPYLYLARKMLDEFIKDVEATKERLGL